jgi:hypothetical protein
MPEAAHTSYADRIMIAMGAERDALGLIGGKPLPVEARDRVLNAMTALFIQEALKAAKPPKKEKKPKQPEMTDEEWICSLEKDEAFNGLNVRAEIARCGAWCRQNVKKSGPPTRKRIVNWLIKADKVMDLRGQGATLATGLKLPAPQGPNGWIKWAETELATLTEEHPAFGQVRASINCRSFSMLPASWRERCQRQTA